MICNLLDIAKYVNDMIPIDFISKDNYISTENMLPNKLGILDAESLPKVNNVKSFKVGDILISNIRPYFKKIWYAKFDGGCSNDVLVLRSKDTNNSRYLYYLLSDDAFFNYAMKTSKGTKMPRGDKKAILEYKIPMLDINIQNKIAYILETLDKKIEINNQINKNLYNQIETLFKLWFQDYSQINNENTKDWREVPLNEIADFINGYSYKGSDLVDKSSVGMATIKNFDRNGGFKLNGYKPIQNIQKIKDNQFIELFDILVAHTDLTQNADVIGNAELVLSKSYFDKIIFSMDLVKVVPKINEISKFHLYSLLRSNSFKQHCLGYVNGTTVLHLSKKALNDYKIFLPIDYSKLKPLEEILETIYNKIAVNISEIEKLEKLRDSLLPKLMNNEIDISKIEL